MNEWIAILLTFQVGGAAPAPGVAPVSTPYLAPVPPPPSVVRQEPLPPDRWFAEDKLRHFFMSFAATGMGYAAARTAGLDREPAIGVGVGGAALAGLWKEWRDLRRGDRFSAKDLVWDAAGIAVGVALASQTR